jgi:hypothetical protein
LVLQELQIVHCTARRGRSYREFAARLGIVLEESDESVFWLVFLSRPEMGVGSELDSILAEACELVAIFTSSVRPANLRQKARPR